MVDEAHNAGLDGSHPVTLQAKMHRLELLNVKAYLWSTNLVGSFFTAHVLRPYGPLFRVSACLRAIAHREPAHGEPIFSQFGSDRR